MQKLKMHSPDMTQEHITRIRELFPNCVTEARGKDGSLRLSVDFDLLRQELSDSIVEGPQERYHLDWPGKREAMLAANAPIAKALRPCREESVDFDTTQNLFIEGDNLDALKLLQETYLGKVKMIYIDPPYNTGNDFIYNDDFAETAEEYLSRSNQKDEAGNRLVANTDSNGRFHSDWLSMMYPRLKLARNLLADDGVIFISCDDNEVENIKKICSSLFSNENFIGQITIVSNPRGRDYGGIARMHDYILSYRKTNSTEINLIKDESSNFPFYDNIGGFELRELRNRNVKFNKENRPNLYYPFYIDEKSKDSNELYKISLENQDGFIELFPKASQGINTVWRWGKQKARENLNTNIAAKKMRDGGYMIVEKYRESKAMARSVWWDKFSNTERGTLLVKKIFGGKYFDYPKPVEMIMRLCEMGTSNEPEDLILDFFAGSSTTAHAVMQLNAEDGGNRRFIMVQLPEACDEKSEAARAGYSSIAEISKERIRRAGKNILEGDCHEGWNRDVGFRVLKVDTSNMADVFYTPDALQQSLLDMATDNVKPGRSPEDLLFQVLLDWGVELTLPIRKESIQGKTVFFVDENALVACFDQGIDETLVRELTACKPLRVIFRDNGFVSDAVKINVEQVFRQLSPTTEVRCL